MVLTEAKTEKKKNVTEHFHYENSQRCLRAPTGLTNYKWQRKPAVKMSRLGLHETSFIHSLVYLFIKFLWNALLCVILEYRKEQDGPSPCFYGAKNLETTGMII